MVTKRADLNTKALIYAQAKGYGGVQLKMNGLPLQGGTGKCVRVDSVLDAKIADSNQGRGLHEVVPLGKFIPLFLQSLEANLAARIPGQPSEVAPLVADKVHPALVPWERDQAEQFKVEVSLYNTLAQKLAAGKATKANAADPRALLNSFTKEKKYGFMKMVAASACHPYGSRATYTKANDAKTLAIRGSTPSLIGANLMGLPH